MAPPVSKASSVAPGPSAKVKVPHCTSDPVKADVHETCVGPRAAGSNAVERVRAAPDAGLRLQSRFRFSDRLVTACWGEEDAAAEPVTWTNHQDKQRDPGQRRVKRKPESGPWEA
ncbi:hypothetical protein TARUN_7014 [Trichoderma arundinaceum]|uniref:Uncharacterized protein n=1 Tax=Trichoderma arundinaceum TaxID=490622 RepID=A0A395NGR7_TRIAR|nr:hypothetical protein TARUN_7014 [Trichoderma arundinaceum]